MYTGHHYSFKEFLYWTRDFIYLNLAIAIVPTVLFQVLGWKWLAIPWVPIAMIGTAAAFIIGFKNTQTYNRLWEARQIYGAIVNSSRAWGIMVKDLVTDKAAHQELIYRHIAWLTALRHQLREPREWENSNSRYNREYQQYYDIPERNSTLEADITPYLSKSDKDYVFGKKNRATHIISLQSSALRVLKYEGKIEPLDYVEMEKRLVDLYDQQGKCERIKNFPYPRHFASLNLFFVRLFTFIVPFGLLQEFSKMGGCFIWLNIPFSLIVTWVFCSMERIGESTENPFEGGANDVPISALSRTIEIDLREMLDEINLPPAIAPTHKVLM